MEKASILLFKRREYAVLYRMLFLFVATIMCTLTFASESNAAELYHDQELYAEPATSSQLVGRAPVGPVSVVGRRGFWAKVKSGELVGWTKLSNLKIEPAMLWMSPIDTLKDTGRMAAGKE